MLGLHPATLAIAAVRLGFETTSAITIIGTALAPPSETKSVIAGDVFSVTFMYEISDAREGSIKKTTDAMSMWTFPNPPQWNYLNVAFEVELWEYDSLSYNDPIGTFSVYRTYQSYEIDLNNPVKIDGFYVVNFKFLYQNGAKISVNNNNNNNKAVGDLDCDVEIYATKRISVRAGYTYNTGAVTRDLLSNYISTTELEDLHVGTYTVKK
jgi:hypothetical protein